MNDQPTPPNSAGSGERVTGVRPEDLQAGTPVAESAPAQSAAAAEVAPAPGGSASPPPSPAQASPKLSADDVAAAIAATPGPPAPGGNLPTPSLASDVDVIEPEWVDKAENVIAQHQGDPYGEEEAIEDLQQDYLKKRYGYDVGNPNSDGSKPDSSKPEGT